VLGSAGFVVGAALRGRFRSSLHWDRSAELVPATVGLLLTLLEAFGHVASRPGLPMLVAAVLGLLVALPILLWVPQRVYAVALGIGIVAIVAYGSVRTTIASAEDRLLDTTRWA
jgi:uncharacterized membrane protein YfcA